MGGARIAAPLYVQDVGGPTDRLSCVALHMQDARTHRRILIATAKDRWRQPGKGDMAATASKQTGDIEMRLVAYHNCDDVELFWRVSVAGQPDAPIPDVLGFKIERQGRRADGTWGGSEILRNRVGFTDGAGTSSEENDSAPSRSSNIWPFQSYDWTDHGANSGQTVRYRVSAVRLLDGGGTPGTTRLVAVADTDWSTAIE